jgi:DNA-binding response OmpR family regulator
VVVRFRFDSFTPMCSDILKPRILLVEDSEDDVFFFELALRKSGWTCDYTHVIDGGQAIEYLETLTKGGTAPDLVFLDLKLPVFNGFEVLQWIGSKNFQPAIPVVILSGSDHHADIRLARELGAIDYMVKPISAEDLKKRLGTLSASKSVRSTVDTLKPAAQ